MITYDIKTIKNKKNKHHPFYKITKDGKSLSQKEVADIYKPLTIYPFVDLAWAYYHLGELKNKVSGE